MFSRPSTQSARRSRRPLAEIPLNAPFLRAGHRETDETGTAQRGRHATNTISIRNRRAMASSLPLDDSNGLSTIHLHAAERKTRRPTEAKMRRPSRLHSRFATMLKWSLLIFLAWRTFQYATAGEASICNFPGSRYVLPSCRADEHQIATSEARIVPLNPCTNLADVTVQLAGIQDLRYQISIMPMKLTNLHNQVRSAETMAKLAPLPLSPIK